MPRNYKLAEDVKMRIQDLLLTGMSVPDVRKAINDKVSRTQLYNMARNLEEFETVSPASICKTRRPRSITPEAQEGIVEFLYNRAEIKGEPRRSSEDDQSIPEDFHGANGLQELGSANNKNYG
jgi:hypothetical protein